MLDTSYLKIDLLYYGTHEEVENYYKETENRRIENQKRYSEAALKDYMVFILNEVSNGKYTIDDDIVINGKYSMRSETSWSIPEFIYNTGMTKEQFESAIKFVVENDSLPYMYEYNIDMIFNSKGYMEKNMNVKHPVLVDEMIRKN